MSGILAQVHKKQKDRISAHVGPRLELLSMVVDSIKKLSSDPKFGPAIEKYCGATSLLVLHDAPYYMPAGREAMSLFSVAETLDLVVALRPNQLIVKFEHQADWYSSNGAKIPFFVNNDERWADLCEVISRFVDPVTLGEFLLEGSYRHQYRLTI